MSDRRNELSQMLDTTLTTFTRVLLESKNLSKLTRHREIHMTKSDVDTVMAHMVEATRKKVHERTSKLIDDNCICQRFDELEELVKESEELNRALGREAGYHFVKPKRDIAFHLSEANDEILSAADAEIERLEKELEAEDEELSRRKQILAELTTVVESQQHKLWDSAEAN